MLATIYGNRGFIYLIVGETGRLFLGAVFVVVAVIVEPSERLANITLRP